MTTGLQIANRAAYYYWFDINGDLKEGRAVEKSTRCVLWALAEYGTEVCLLTYKQEVA